MSQTIRRSLDKWANWLAIGLLLLFFARLLDTAAQQSATFDEGFHLLQGALYWQRPSLYSVTQNPPLVNALIGLPVHLALRPSLPPEMGDEVFQNWLPVGRAFLWEVNTNGRQILWVGRLAVMLLALLLAALVYRWSGRLSGRLAGLLALLLFTVDPNILAHSFLATTDLGAAFFFCLAGYGVWRYWRRVDMGQVSVGYYLAAGLGVGGLLAAKFSGLIVAPALALLAVSRRLWGRVRLSPVRAAAEIAGWLLLGALLLLAVYRFQWEPLRVDFTLQQEHQRAGHSAFLLGQVSRDGWWYYFPVILAVKTPLTALALLGLSLVVVGRRPWHWSLLWLLLLAGGLLAAGLLSRVNIGYRYLLPALPLLYVVAGRLAAPGSLKSPRLRGAVILALLLLAAESAWIHPDYLAYFNQLVGGQANGWRVAVDSNLDWGQDLQRLAQTQQARGWPRLRASWLGTAPPQAYGLQADFLPGWPWQRPDALYDDFYPDRPAPGLYALSATQLQGVYLDDPDAFSWFRQRPPDFRVGYSFFVYDVPAEGEPAALALSGIGLPMLDPADFEAAFGGNNVRPLWYDARRSFIWPGNGDGRAWLAVGDGHRPDHPALLALYPSAAWQGERTLDGVTWRYHLFQLTGSLAETAAYRPTAETAVFGDTLRLLGAQPLWPGTPQPGQTMELITYWRVQRPPVTDLKLFVHCLNEAGELVAQHDGLDVQTRNLAAGDELAQLHTLALPADLPPGAYTLRLGVYDPATFGRLPLVMGAETADGLEVFVFNVP